MTSFALEPGLIATDDGAGRFFERLAKAMSAAFGRAAPRAVSPTEDHNNDVTLLAQTELLRRLVDPEEERKNRRQQGLPDLGGLRIQWAGPNRPTNVDDRMAEILLEKKLGLRSMQLILNHVRRMGLGRSAWDVFVKDWTNNGGKIARPTPSDLLLALEG